MRYHLIGNDPKRAAEWAKTRFPDTPHEPYWGEDFNAIIQELDNDIVACVIYNQHYPANSIDMHIAAIPGRRWLTRPFLSVCFRYPFVQLGVRRVTARIGANNPAILRFVKRLGFVHEGTVRQGWEADVDLLIYGMLKSECRYLEYPYARPPRPVRELRREVYAGPQQRVLPMDAPH